MLFWSIAALVPGAVGAHQDETPDPAATPPVATPVPTQAPAASETPAPTAVPAPAEPAAAGATASPSPDAAPGSSPEETAVRGVVADFHRALVEGYRDGVLKLLDEGAVIFETGFVEVDREQYATGHLDSDLMFSAQVKREVVHSEATVAGDMAVVLTQSRNAGDFMDAKINLENTETMVLRRGADGWKIVHIHWSGHDRAPESPAP
ncbi:MAG: nuclear transport factor 2 family protein [Sinimarinibacterium sp.]